MTAPVVPCSVCGVALTLAELRFLWSDRDFLDHGGRGDHYASISAEHEPTYFALMGSGLRDEPCPVCHDGRVVHTCAPVADLNENLSSAGPAAVELNQGGQS